MNEKEINDSEIDYITSPYNDIQFSNTGESKNADS